MVNFHDPEQISMDAGACAPRPFSRSQKITEHIFQVYLHTSGYLWMVSSCGLSSHWHSAAPTCHITLFFTLSWEIVTTLDYEWNVIRGRRPYRWTIWVCNLFPFSVFSVTFQCETDCSRGSSSTLLPVWPPSRLWLCIYLPLLRSQRPRSIVMYVPCHSSTSLYPFLTALFSQDCERFTVCAYPNTVENSRTGPLAPFYHFIPRPWVT